MRARVAVIAVPCLITLTAAARRRAVRVGHDLELVAERSFIVTDKPILEPFTFERVLDTLVERNQITESSKDFFTSIDFAGCSITARL